MGSLYDVFYNLLGSAFGTTYAADHPDLLALLATFCVCACCYGLFRALFGLFGLFKRRKR